MTLIDYNLFKEWKTHWLINSLRKEIEPLVLEKKNNSKIPFDPQDLEHQVLFYLTTISPGKITKEIIKSVVEEQYLIIKARLLYFSDKDELNYLMRGIKCFYPDLNAKDRLHIKYDKDRILAAGSGREFEVIFKLLNDEHIIKLYTVGLHYIHAGRIRGDCFGLFFKGDRYPFALETAEPSTHSKWYKRKALELHGFNPDKGIELTRLYSLPGAPKGAISFLDNMVQDHYKKQGIEVIFTCCMPSYAKTSGSTVCGGMDKVLLIKEQEHYFLEKIIENRKCWQAITRRDIEKNKIPQRVYY